MEVTKRYLSTYQAKFNDFLGTEEFLIVTMYRWKEFSQLLKGERQGQENGRK